MTTPQMARLNKLFSQPGPITRLPGSPKGWDEIWFYQQELLRHLAAEFDIAAKDLIEIETTVMGEYRMRAPLSYDYNIVNLPLFLRFLRGFPLSLDIDSRREVLHKTPLTIAEFYERHALSQVHELALVQAGWLSTSHPSFGLVFPTAEEEFTVAHLHRDVNELNEADWEQIFFTLDIVRTSRYLDNTWRYLAPHDAERFPAIVVEPLRSAVARYGYRGAGVDEEELLKFSRSLGDRLRLPTFIPELDLCFADLPGMTPSGTRKKATRRS